MSDGVAPVTGTGVPVTGSEEPSASERAMVPIVGATLAMSRAALTGVPFLPSGEIGVTVTLPLRLSA